MPPTSQQTRRARHRTSRRRGLAASATVAVGAFIAAGAVSLASAGTSSAATIAGDLACGKTATATSTASGSPANATDCDTSTAWQSAASTPQELMVDLGTATTVDHVSIVWGSGYATSFKIRTSSNGTSWHTE
ncbi:MAG: hypothetical protein QOF98_2427, partial [Streptomyces sp.]|nr:hypothetical protein [Streptomyces sp.]